MTKNQKIYTGIAIVGLVAVAIGAYYYMNKNRLKMANPVKEQTEQEKYLSIMNQPDETKVVNPVNNPVSAIRFTGPEIKSDLLEM